MYPISAVPKATYEYVRASISLSSCVECYLQRGFLAEKICDVMLHQLDMLLRSSMYQIVRVGFPK